MIEYFPNSYWSNLMFCNAVTCGATVSDLDDACRQARNVLRAGSPDSSPFFREALHEGYLFVADRLQRSAAADLAAGRRLSAGAKEIRAAALLLALEMQMTDFLSPAKTAMFDRFRTAFRKGIELDASNHTEFVSVPYGAAQLDGAFVPALQRTPGPMPVIVHLNGGHSTMEWPYLTGLTQALARRGVASLVFDHPGSGTGRYHKGLKFRYDSEVFVAAAIDYLERRRDVDKDRIGVCGASFGGYLAPRATAFEQRIKACVVWSALFEVTPQRYFGGFPPDGPFDAATDFKLQGLRWQFGVETNEALWNVVKRFTLADVIEKITVPLFVVHGSDDIQTPLFNATRMMGGAVNSSRAELLVVTAEQGGTQHCNLDNLPTARDAMADFAAQALGSTARKPG